MKAHAIAILLSLLVSTGCTARLAVRKVDTCDDRDHTSGFRYYLSRPYIVVKQPILVSERIELLPDDPKKPKIAVPVAGGKVTEITIAELERLKHEALADPKIKQAAYAQERELPPPPAAPFDTVPSNVGKHLDIPADAPRQLSDKGSIKGNIDIIYLPDFEECYAVRCKNAMAKSAYKLNFRDGWELTDVSGEFNSTTLAIEVLNAIDNAITAAQDIETAEIDRQKEIADAAAKSPPPSGAKNLDEAETLRFQEITRIYIKPGVYRINKPWEIEGGLQAQHGQGLLSSLGLSLIQVHERRVLPQRPVRITNDLYDKAP